MFHTTILQNMPFITIVCWIMHDTMSIFILFTTVCLLVSNIKQGTQNKYLCKVKFYLQGDTECNEHF